MARTRGRRLQGRLGKEGRLFTGEELQGNLSTMLSVFPPFHAKSRPLTVPEKRSMVRPREMGRTANRGRGRLITSFVSMASEMQSE